VKLSSSAIALCFGRSFLEPSLHEPFKENGKVYIGGFVGEAVSVIYENLNFAKDTRADPCGTIA